MTLREIREENGKKPSEVATALNVTLRAVYNYEYGIRQINISQVLILAQLFDCSEREIIQAQLNSCQQAREDNQT